MNQLVEHHNEVNVLQNTIEREQHQYVFLHGFGQTNACFEPFIQIFQAALKNQKILFSNPNIVGHGQNPWLSPDFVTAANDQFEATGSGTYIGYSFGGRLALQMALRHKDIHKLILISASPGLADSMDRTIRRKEDDQLAKNIEHNGVEWFVSWWLDQPLFCDLPEPLQFRSDRLINHAYELAQCLTRYGTGVQPSLWEYLPELSQPTLLITGSLDRKFTQIATEMVSFAPQMISHVKIPNAGHSVHLTHPNETAQAILNWEQTL